VARELLFPRPVIVTVNEDAVTIPVEAEAYAEAAHQAAEQSAIVASVFDEEEFGDWNFANGVVGETEQSELWAVIFQPAVEAAVQQQHFDLACAREAGLAMRGNRSLAGPADVGRTQQTARVSRPTEKLSISQSLGKRDGH
jgi:hypothetical protein